MTMEAERSYVRSLFSEDEIPLDFSLMRLMHAAAKIMREEFDIDLSCPFAGVVAGIVNKYVGVKSMAPQPTGPSSFVTPRR